MKPKERKESEENQGKPKETIEEQVKRDLEAQVPWNVISKTRHVSTKTISAIKNKGISAASSDGEIAARAYNLFECGVGPIGVVIELKHPPEVIQGYHDKWLEQKGLILFPRQVRDRVYAAINANAGIAVTDPAGLAKAVEYLVARHNTLSRFTFPGAYCKRPIEAPDGIWKWLVQNGHLNEWDHKECVVAHAQLVEQQRLEEERKQQLQQQTWQGRLTGGNGYRRGNYVLRDV